MGAAFGKTVSQEEKVSVMELIHPLFQGDEKVNCTSPDTVLWIYEDGVQDQVGDHDSGMRKHIFFGRQVGVGRSIDRQLKDYRRPFFARFANPQRAILGPTTLDNEL